MSFVYPTEDFIEVALAILQTRRLPQQFLEFVEEFLPMKTFRPHGPVYPHYMGLNESVLFITYDSEEGLLEKRSFLHLFLGGKWELVFYLDTQEGVTLFIIIDELGHLAPFVSQGPFRYRVPTMEELDHRIGSRGRALFSAIEQMTVASFRINLHRASAELLWEETMGRVGDLEMAMMRNRYLRYNH